MRRVRGRIQTSRATEPNCPIIIVKLPSRSKRSIRFQRQIPPPTPLASHTAPPLHAVHTFPLLPHSLLLVPETQRSSEVQHPSQVNAVHDEQYPPARSANPLHFSWLGQLEQSSPPAPQSKVSFPGRQVPRSSQHPSQSCWHAAIFSSSDNSLLLLSVSSIVMHPSDAMVTAQNTLHQNLLFISSPQTYDRIL